MDNDENGGATVAKLRTLATVRVQKGHIRVHRDTYHNGDVDFVNLVVYKHKGAAVEVKRKWNLNLNGLIKFNWLEKPVLR